MIYTRNRITATKQLVACGKLKGKNKKTTVKEMSNEDYQNMVGPLFTLLNKRAAK